MKKLLLFLIVLVFSKYSIAEEVVFLGVPISMTVSSHHKSYLEKVPADNLLKWGCKIIKEDGKYFWASNRNRELIYIPGESASYFYAKEGGGYIKVMGGYLTGLDVNFGYAEAFEQYSEVRVFWGISETFSP